MTNTDLSPGRDNLGWALRPARPCGFLVMLLLLGTLQPSPVAAGEPYLEFVEGLRARRYYDTAVDYLDMLEKRSDVPADIKTIVPYQKAITLVAGSQFVQNPDAQAERLDEAQAYLETFLKQSPNHPLAAVANTELARIMLGKAEVLVWRAKSPSNTENRSKFQGDARQLIQNARAIFQKAKEAYETAWKAFPVYIPEDDRAGREARDQAQVRFMIAQLDLAKCTYQEAQTYDKGSDKFSELLRQASLEFEDVHTKYRSQYAGLYARTMQGKCFEEEDTKDGIRKAMGIYDELLDHPGKSKGLQTLQHEVRHFRLICLNHESRKDYQLAILEAGDWLKVNRGISRTPTGLGIRWELARAQEALANERTTAEADRTRLLRQALENAREITKFSSPYKDVANSMIQRVLVALDREPGDPTDFETAFGTANSMLEQVGELREGVKTAEKSGDADALKNAEGELQAHLSETERMYRLALALADPSVPGKSINAARYRLAYMFYLQRQSFETAVIGEYLSVRAYADDPGMALDGAYLAMAGYSQAYNDASEDAKATLLDLMVRICERIATTWPDSDRATDARLEMGRIYRRSAQPLDAAKWYAEVPSTVPQYGSAQIEAGQAFWNAYLTAVANADADVTPAELTAWQNSAADYLTTGINESVKKIPADAPTPAEVTKAKVSLAQIEIMRGNEAEAVKWLTADPHPVTAAVAVPDGSARPSADFEVKSTTFASFAYQQLLRAYIGTRQLDQAEQARAELEKIAGASGGEALTAVYVELGRELQNELERLKKQNDQARVKEVRAGFESFLKQLFDRKEGQTYGSLIWIAETYFGLAESSADEPTQSGIYYDAAAETYGEILKRADRDSGFLDAGRVTGVKLRLVNCKRQQGDFAGGEEIVKEILKDRPRALDAQIEAAALYQAWGEENDPEKLLTAVKGIQFDDGTFIWGWGNIAKRLQQLIDNGQGNPEYAERNRESRYRLAETRLEYAEQSSDLNESEDQLKKAKFELIAFASISPDLPETPWWEKYDTIYQTIQRNLGEAAVPLQKPEPIVAAAPGTKSLYDAGESAPAEVAETADPAPAAESGGGMLSMILLGVVLLAGLGGAGWFVMNSGKGGRKRSVADRFTESKTEITLPAARPANKSAPKARVASGDRSSREARPTKASAASRESRTERPEKRRAQPSSGSPAAGSPSGEKRRVRKKPPEASE